MIASTRGFPFDSLSPRRAALLSAAVLVLSFAAAAQAQITPAGPQGEDVLRLLTPAETARYLAGTADKAVQGDVPGVLDGLLATKIDEDAGQFIVPRFRVDTTSSLGTTTLFAVRNTRTVSTMVSVVYFSNTGSVLHSETFNLSSRQILTRNVRDVGGLVTDADGYKTGFIIITGSTGALLSVDLFQVDPGNNFATGSRAVDVTGLYLCDLWDVRYLAGGIFSGGTTLNLVINSPQGTGAGADPSVVFRVTSEGGTTYGLVGLYTPRLSTTTSVFDILAAANPGVPPFGALEVDFGNALGGVVEAVYDADGRFSIGLKGSCVTP